MSRRPSRRAVLALGGAAAGGAVAPAALARAKQGPPLVLFDPAEPDARAFARAETARGARPLPLKADRVQIARLVFGQHRPERVTGMTRYADYLLLSDSAREAGYRKVSMEPQAGTARDLFLWIVERGPA